jgi:general L-amino acid transport system substrate-binding protein
MMHGRERRHTMKRIIQSLTAAGGAVLLACAACAAATLDMVKDRGLLRCGANGELTGFGFVDAEGRWSGLDVDFCRAIAAAIFNDTGKVTFVPLSASSRFTALANADIDVLVRNSSWTLSREAALGLATTGVNYYDHQGLLVRRSSRINSALGLSGKTVCVQKDTTSELNLDDYVRLNRMQLNALGFATLTEAASAYESGRCDALSAGLSGLYGARAKFAKADDHVVLPEIIAREPRGPFVRQGDDQWFTIVRWVHFAMLSAEELNVGRANVDERMRSDSPEIRRLLGIEGNFGETLGLTRDWVYRIVKLVGNYGDVFERNVGQASPLKIARGLNALWTKGGVQYAPPIR